MAFASLFIATTLAWFFNNPHLIECGITSQWDYCGCRWEEWEGWGTCSSECNGIRWRSRKVWLYTNKAGCVFEFNTCATSDMGWDDSRCNTFCYNGGTSDSYSCSCVTGYYGSCCGFQVDCGNPGSLEYGYVNGGTYTYGSSISYSCQTGYLLVDGSTTRTCQLNATWSGIKPRCAYYNSCASNPCKNGATCANIPDEYICTCSSGWSGKNCDIDVQPPVMTNCSKDVQLTTSSLTESVIWPIPEFHDPHNFGITVTPNYLTNEFIFPWGDFNISYSALKPSNGLSTECVFTIGVRPNQCPDINAPVNGALVCNNWKTDYGRFCTILCQDTYTVARGVNPDDFYVCGASGSWTPDNKIPDCSVKISSSPAMTGYNYASTFTNCSDDIQKIQNYYIEKISGSEFDYFCKKFPMECNANNVFIKC